MRCRGGHSVECGIDSAAGDHGMVGHFAAAVSGQRPPQVRRQPPHAFDQHAGNGGPADLMCVPISQSWLGESRYLCSTAWTSWRRIRSRSAARCASSSSSHTATCAANSLSAMVSSSQREKSPRSRWYWSARGIEMPYRGAEITHSACCGDDLAVDWPEVEPPLSGQGDVGIFVAVPHVGRPALCDSEPTRRPGAETHTGPP